MISLVGQLSSRSGWILTGIDMGLSRMSSVLVSLGRACETASLPGSDTRGHSCQTKIQQNRDESDFGDVSLF